MSNPLPVHVPHHSHVLQTRLKPCGQTLSHKHHTHRPASHPMTVGQDCTLMSPQPPRGPGTSLFINQARPQLQVEPGGAYFGIINTDPPSEAGVTWSPRRVAMLMAEHEFTRTCPKPVTWSPRRVTRVTPEHERTRTCPKPVTGPARSSRHVTANFIP